MEETSFRKFWLPFGLATLLITGILSISLRRQPPRELSLTFAGKPESIGLEFALRGWTVTPEGLAAAQGPSSLILIRFFKERFQGLFLDLDLPARSREQLRVQFVIPDGGRPAKLNLPEKASGSAPFQLFFGKKQDNIDGTALARLGTPVNLSRVWAGQGKCHLAIQPAKGARSPLLRAVKITKRIAPCAPLLALVCLPAILLAFYQLLCLQERFPASLGFKIVIGFFCLAAWVQPEVLLAALPGQAVILTALAFIPSLLRREKNPVPAALLLVALITCLGGILRWESFNEMRFRPLDPDAAVFAEIAHSMHWFYDTREREPLPILWIKALFLLLSEGPLTVRLASLLCSILLIPVIYKVGKELFGTPAGIVSALLLAANSSWAWQAPRGLRLEMFTLGLLVFTWAVLSPRTPTCRRHILWAGLAGAALCLVRATGLWLCLIGILFLKFRQHWQWRHAALAAALVISPLVPFWIHCAVQFGSPFYKANQTARFYRNQEFKGQPRMPTVEEVSKNSYAGPKVTPLRYFFGMHSLRELARRSVLKTVDVFWGGHFHRATCDSIRLLAWLAGASYLVIAFTPQRLLLVWMLLLLGPIAWFYGGGSNPEWRLVFHLSAFVYVCIGGAVTHVLQRFWKPETIPSARS